MKKTWILTLGAAGAMIGTRFEATHESLLSAAESKVMLKAKAADTTSGRAIDIAARRCRQALAGGPAL